MNELFTGEKFEEKVALVNEWCKKTELNNTKKGIEERNISDVKSQYCKDCIWLLWEIIFEETNLRDDKIKIQVQSLYRFFRYEYTSGKRNTRLPLIYHAIGLLTFPIQFNIPIRMNRDLFIQSQCNINIMFINFFFR